MVAAPILSLHTSHADPDEIRALERERAKQRNARLRAMAGAHFEFVWRTLRGVGVPEASVEDAAQKVFWIAAEKLELIAVGSERAFLFSTACGVAANERRSRERCRELSDNVALRAIVDDAPDPEQAAERSQAWKLIEQVLLEMPEDLRTVFVLFELEGLASAYIAELLEIPAGTAASRLRRARQEFQFAVARLQSDAGA